MPKRTSLLLIALAATFLLAGLSSEPALADEIAPHVDLICSSSANVALVRFGYSDNDGPAEYSSLPSSADDGLSTEHGTDRTDCKLPDGTTIRIRSGEGQAFAYGMGGADPPAFFSLWINRRKVVSRKDWHHGYGEQGPELAGVVVRSDSLTYCADITPDAQTTKIECKISPLDVAAAPIDDVEYPADPTKKIPVGTVLVDKQSPDAALCRRYLEQNGPRALSDSSSLDNSWTLRPEAESRGLTESTLKGPFGNIGDRNIVEWSGQNHYFDGDFIAIVPRAEPVDRVFASLKNGPYDDIESEILKLSPPGWTVISGGRPSLYPNVSPRYVHFVAESLGGDVYFLAYPSNNSELPTAILVRPEKIGGFTPVCVFNRVEEHF